MNARHERTVADVVLRHWQEGKDSAVIASLVGIPEADVERIISRHLDRRYRERRTR